MTPIHLCKTKTRNGFEIELVVEEALHDASLQVNNRSWISVKQREGMGLRLT